MHERRGRVPPENYKIQLEKLKEKFLEEFYESDPPKKGYRPEERALSDFCDLYAAIRDRAANEEALISRVIGTTAQRDQGYRQANRRLTIFSGSFLTLSQQMPNATRPLAIRRLLFFLDDLKRVRPAKS